MTGERADFVALPVVGRIARTRSFRLERISRWPLNEAAAGRGGRHHGLTAPLTVGRRRLRYRPGHSTNLLAEASMPASARAILLPALSSLLVLAAACEKKGAAPADSAGAPAAAASSSGSSGGDALLADVTNYKLSMDKVDKYIAAQRNMAAKMKSMTPAEREAVKARGESRNSDPNASLDDMARTIESEPVMNDAVRAAGLSPREFALVTISMMQTAMAASVLKMRPKDNQDSLVREMKANPDNIKFYREHEAEITRKSQELQAEMKAAGMANEE